MLTLFLLSFSVWVPVRAGSSKHLHRRTPILTCFSDVQFRYYALSLRQLTSKRRERAERRQSSLTTSSNPKFGRGNESANELVAGVVRQPYEGQGTTAIYELDDRDGKKGGVVRIEVGSDFSTCRAFRFPSLLTLLSQNHPRPFYSKRRVFRLTSPWMKTTLILRIGCVTTDRSFDFLSHFCRLPRLLSSLLLVMCFWIRTSVYPSPSFSQAALSLSFNLNATTVFLERGQERET